MYSAIERKIIEASDFRLLLTDHSKFGKQALEKAAEFSEIDCIETDAGINQSVLAKYREYVNTDIAE